MFYTHQSNRLENLFAQLAQYIRQPLANVFAPETIIVQSQGMARWLALELAKVHGISANLDCPFPASFIWRLFQHLDPQLKSSPVSPYDPNSLVWSVMEKIQEFSSDDDFSDIRSFLEVDESDTRTFQLSSKISMLLDSYLMHRPDWIETWSNGELTGKLGASEKWQAKLWKEIIDDHGADKHRAALFKRFISNCDETFMEGFGCQRLFLLGIPALSQLHLDVFAHLSRFIDIHLFLLTPCAEFTDDLVGVRELERLRITSRNAETSLEYYELGCPLLMSLGGMGLDFAAMLNNYGFLGAQPDELYEEPQVDSVLSVLHNDLLKGTNNHNGMSPVQLSEDDESVQIHSAHSPMREVEILHDSLLKMFNDSNALTSSDIVVMVPDISQYAPLVEAVFSSPHSARAEIPYSIADQSATDSIVLAFTELLHIATSRFAASELLSLLEREPIRQHFEMSVDDLTKVRHWVVTAGIRWGKNTSQRKEQHSSEDRVGTWQNGLDRLMLGFAMPGNSGVFGDLLPCDAVEGGDVTLLARLLSYFETLKQCSDLCSSPKKISEWREVLCSLLGSFFDENESNYSGLQKIRSVLEEIERGYEAAKVSFSVSINVIVSVFEKKVSDSRDHHFLSGRVTFCQMVPMRSIPFKVICLLGMNDDSFPRQDMVLGFDLMHGRPRPGDRCRRDDDRYLFLETLLSARQNLYISYVGQSDTDHREIPPSTVVRELMEYLSGRFDLGADGKERFLTKHALQPFSPRYFSSELSSFSKINREIARSLSGEKTRVDFFENHKSASHDIEEIELIELIRFYYHPVKYLLNTRYDLCLDDYHDQVDDRSCFELDSLQRYSLSCSLSHEILHSEIDEQLVQKYQLAGNLPTGISGAYYFEQSLNCARDIEAQFSRLKTGSDIEPISFVLDCGGVKLVGNIDGMTDSGQYLYRPTYEKSISYRDIISVWIRHLVLSACRENTSTTFICRNGVRQFEYYSDAENLLETITKLYLMGQEKPLPLFPGASFSYAKKLWGGKKGGTTTEKALLEARKKWQSGDYYDGPECMDPYLYTVYQGHDPFGEAGEYSFCAIAEAVLAPPLLLGKKLK